MLSCVHILGFLGNANVGAFVVVNVKLESRFRNVI
jgi:hypothetical protein